MGTTCDQLRRRLFPPPAAQLEEPVLLPGRAMRRLLRSFQKAGPGFVVYITQNGVFCCSFSRVRRIPPESCQKDGS
jgi:hypothetical protein